MKLECADARVYVCEVVMVTVRRGWEREKKIGYIPVEATENRKYIYYSRRVNVVEMKSNKMY